MTTKFDLYSESVPKTTTQAHNKRGGNINAPSDAALAQMNPRMIPSASLDKALFLQLKKK